MAKFALHTTLHLGPGRHLPEGESRGDGVDDLVREASLVLEVVRFDCDLFQGSGMRVHDSYLVQDSDMLQGLGCRVQGPGLRVKAGGGWGTATASWKLTLLFKTNWGLARHPLVITSI